MKGTAIGLVAGSFFCFSQSFEYFQGGDGNGLIMLVIGSVFLLLARYAWNKEM